MTTTRDTQEEVEQLCQNLHNSLKLKKEGRGKKVTNTVHNTNFKVDSWKFNEWDYPKLIENNILPIHARGLFTLEDNSIVVRGYDKFFNVGEVNISREENLIKNTEGPYEVTLKENGCIILIGGLPSGDIIVCSKHSTGERENLEVNHALEGESQLINQLTKLNKNLGQLGKYLHENNLTAVAELCDDTFEEHVLPYSKEEAGLYLHGLNFNTSKFKTLPMDKVYEFASAWGFKKNDSFSHDDPVILFEFFNEAKKTGKYKGKEVEGFVVRCKLNGDDLFFKYKFEQPYLLYRQFREVTKRYLNSGDLSKVRIKTNKYITGKYLTFVANLFDEKPHLKEEFLSGHGIINARKLFLESIGENDGMNLLNIDRINEGLEKLSLGTKSENEIKYVFIPIATISCGKTTTFQTLVNLFPKWAHVQNDNISRGTKFKLVDQCLKQLYVREVVLLDRNNSEYFLRKQLFSDFEKKSGTFLENAQLKFIGLNFISNELLKDEKQLWDITFGRTKARGDNHQSIKYESDPKTATAVMKKFLHSFQEVNPKIEPDSNFDLIINLNLQGKNSTLENVKTILNQLYTSYPELIPEHPTNVEVKRAFDSALNYVPTFTKVMSKKNPTPSFIGVDIDPILLTSRLDEVLETNAAWTKLKLTDRVQKTFHVTLGHVASAKGDPVLKAKWKTLTELFQVKEKKSDKEFLEDCADVRLLKVVVQEEKLICVTVEIIVYKEGKKIEIEPVNKILHITIGTFSKNVKPMESNITLGKLSEVNILKNGDDGSTVFDLSGDVFIKQKVFVLFA